METTRSNGPSRPAEQVARAQLDPTAQAGARQVLARERERVLGAVDRDDRDARVLVGDRERDRAGARADVEHTRRLKLPQVIEAALDDHLGLGPGNERPPVHREGQPPEAPLPEDVGERLPGAPPRDQLPEPPKLLLVERTVRRVETGAR